MPKYRVAVSKTILFEEITIEIEDKNDLERIVMEKIPSLVEEEIVIDIAESLIDGN